MESDWPQHAHGFTDTRERFFDPNDRTLYQEDGAHPTGAGDGVLAQLFYNEVDRILLGSSYVQTIAAASRPGAPVASASVTLTQQPIGAAVSAVAGAPTAAASALLGTPVSFALSATAGAPTANAVATIGSAITTAVAASAGAPTASAVGVVGTVIVGTVSASAGAPVAAMSVTIPEVRLAQVTAVAGAPTAAVDAFFGTDVDATIIAMAGAPVASSSAWIGDYYLDGAVAAAAGAPIASSRVFLGHFRPFSGQVEMDGRVRARHCGERFDLRFTGLTDALGNRVDTDAHLHVFADGIQVAVLNRSSGQVVYDSGSNTYTASYRQDVPALLRGSWHFPEIELASEPIDIPVRGPALVEPTV